MIDYMGKKSGGLDTRLPSIVEGLGVVQPGSTIKCVVRYGCHYDLPARDGSPAYVIDLYQRKAILTGRALASAYLEFPEPNALVEVEGVVFRGEADLAIWVLKLRPIDRLGPDECIFDMACPHWVVDQSVVDRARALWASLPDNDRAFINAVFHDERVLRGFLVAPGSCNDHHAYDGGCLLHSVEAAEFAVLASASNSHMDRNLMVTSALVHDAGKAIEYVKTRNGRWRMSRYGRRVGHKITGIQLATIAMAGCRGMSSKRKEDLLHILASSYAPRWVGLRPPATVEAAVLAAVDRLSSESSTPRQS